MKYTTHSIMIDGAICGAAWGARVSPITTGYLRVQDSIFHQRHLPGAKLADILSQYLRDKGGDLDGPSFTADTVVVICRRYHSDTQGRTHYRSYPVIKVARNLVDEEILLSDIQFTEEF